MSVSLAKPVPQMYLIHTEENVRVTRALGYERALELIDRIENAGKHVKPLFFDDFRPALDYTEDRSRQDSLRKARHMARVVENTCTHDGLFYSSRLEITDSQYCPSCNTDVPQYEL